VIWNERPYWADGTNETRLETSGHFKTIPLSPGKYPITVVAQGYRPEQRIVTVDKSLEAQRFVLQPGKRLIMKVVDTSGAPLPQAYVSLGQWRNSESLYNHRHPNVLDSGIPTRANDEGVYIWDWAPDDAVTYEVTAKGHGSTSVTLVANGQEHVVKVLPRLVFSGQVTDAKSGAPIPEFRVIPVTVFRPKFLSTSYGNSVLGKNGEYETSVWTSSERDYRYQLRIEAEGYRSAMCEQTYEPADGAVDIDFSLEPAAARAGIVVGPDGRPVANASIVAGTPSVVPMMSNTDLESASEAPDIKTAVDGRFHLAATFEPERIRFIHESGFAEVLLEPDDEIGTIELAPWASVSGQLVHDGQPVKNETIYFTPVLRRQLGEPRFQDSYYCQTDGDGRFQFERLPAIAGTVKAYLGPWQDSPLTSSQAIPLDLQPGEQRTIALGNDGITITGKVVATGRGNAPLNQNFSLNYLISRDRKVKFPEGFPQLGFDPAAQVEASWFLDQNYHNWLETREHYFVKPSPDGDVHICGVPQGRYDLVLRLYEQPVGCLVQTVGERVVAVDVTAADVAAGVKDIGNIEVPCRVGPQVGENMQLYKFVDVTGRERTLKELSGRHVLMHVWASWCAPCLESMPDIQATVGQLSDESVTFVGLNVDDKNSEAKALAERHGWNWPQSYLGEDSDVARQLAISSVPAYFLIGPDGRLIVSAAEWSEIKEKMEAAISSGVHD
jgi:thiol-disulfide isomerase/thioredoxin